MNIEHHGNYMKRFQLMERALERVLTGDVQDWVSRNCYGQNKRQLSVIQNLAEKHGYRIGDGSTAGYPETPVKMLIAEPAEDYDIHIANLLKDLIQNNILPEKSIIFSDGKPGKDFSRHLSEFAREKNIPIEYNDNLQLFRNLAEVIGYSRRMHELEQRNYHAFSPSLIRNKDKIAVQKTGILEVLEGGIQQNLAAEEIPYLVFLPTGVKFDLKQENAIDKYIKKCIDKTASRLEIR